MSLTVASLVQTTTRDLEDLINVPKSARLDRLRATISQSKRRLVALQTELSNLKSAELLAIQKMNRYVKLKEIEQFYPADRFMLNEPKQAVKPLESASTPDPDARINWTRNRLLKGLESLEAERNRIGVEILQISQEIIKQRQALSDAQKELSSSSDTSLAEDSIAKRNYSELYMLYEIHKKYREISTNSDGVRKYNSDSPIIKLRQRLSAMFNAYADRNPFVKSGDLVLDKKDPGSDENERMLTNMLDRCFSVLGNQTGVVLNDEKRQKYSNQMVSNLNDMFISQHIARQDDSKNIPVAGKALKNETQSPSKLVSFVNEVVTTVQKGVKIYMSWDQTSATNAIQSWFQEQISGLNQGIPLCSADTTASERDIASQSQDQAELKASESIAKRFGDTKKVIDPQIIDDTFTKLLVEVNTAIKEPRGKEITASATLIIKDTVYNGTCSYQVRVINNSSVVTKYLMDVKVSGNLTEDAYNSYLLKLTEPMALTNPALIQESIAY